MRGAIVTWRVILNQTAHNFGMVWRTSSTQGLRRLCQALGQQGTPDERSGSTEKEKLLELATIKMQAVLNETTGWNKV